MEGSMLPRIPCGGLRGIGRPLERIYKHSHQLKGMGRGQHKQGEAVIILRHKMKYSR
jgi:hypothetical protein